MFSQASVILSTIGLMPTRSLLMLVGYSVTCYGAVGKHPTGMFSCLHVSFLSGLDKKDSLHLTEFFAATNTHMTLEMYGPLSKAHNGKVHILPTGIYNK